MRLDHQCRFPEVIIEEGDEDEGGNLKVGMRVLIPCECGETPLDELEMINARADELQASLLAFDPNRPLYHWAPADRRKQIIRYGLRPGMRCTTTIMPLGAMAVCFADSPAWAWALSGEQRHAPTGEWDLWQTWQDRLVNPVVLGSPDRPSGIYEVRTEHRVYKRDLWFVGSRVK